MTEYSLCSSIIAEEPTTDSTRCEHFATYDGAYRLYLLKGFFFFNLMCFGIISVRC